jgi:hypothetical protein
MIQFPSELDDKEGLLRLLGGFWSDTYKGQDLLAEALLSRTTLTKQIFERLQEAIACRSRLNVPLFRTEYWRALVIKKSIVADLASLYGESITYGDGVIYGKRFVGLPFVYPIDSEISDCNLITNRLTDPSVNLVKSIDFLIDQKLKVIRFKANPFNNPLFQIQSTDSGDEEITLWLYKPSIDREYVYTHFGYVIDLWAKTSPEYKNLVNDIYDSIVLGTSAGRTFDAISATTGIRLAKGDETVVAIEEDKDNLLVISDKNAYKFVKGSTALVSIGDSLKKDQPITDGFEYYEFNRGEVPSSIQGVSLSGELLNGKYISEIGFINRLEDTQVSYDDNGKTKLTFTLGGHPFDVDAFWNEVHSRGIVAGRTIANALDTRTNKEGEPAASNLPSEINPFGFLVENVFRYGAFVVKIKSAEVDPEAAGIDKLSYVRRLLPPHTTMILIIDMPSIYEEVEPDDAEPAPETFVAANTFEEDVTEDILQDIITGSVVYGSYV